MSRGTPSFLLTFPFLVFLLVLLSPTTRTRKTNSILPEKCFQLVLVDAAIGSSVDEALPKCDVLRCAAG